MGLYAPQNYNRAGYRDFTEAFALATLLFLHWLAQLFNLGTMARCLSRVCCHSLGPTSSFGRSTAYAAHLSPPDTFAIWAAIAGTASFTAFRDGWASKTKQRCNGGEERSGYGVGGSCAKGATH